MTLIHIGANKAMSTTIQKRIFKEDKLSLFLGVNSAEQLISEKEIYETLNYDNHLYNIEKIRCKIKKAHEELSAVNKSIIFSSEDILTCPIMDRAAERLTTIFPDPKILLIIRKQQDALKSFYASHGAFTFNCPKPYFKRHLSPETWWLHATSNIFRMSGPIPSFDYKLILKTFEKFVSREKIHILVYEESLENLSAFSEKLSDITGINPGKIENALTMFRDNQRILQKRVFVNMITSKVFNFSSEYVLRYESGLKQILIKRLINILPKISIDMQFFEQRLFQTEIHDLYASGNAWVNENYNLNLSRFGYVGC